MNILDALREDHRKVIDLFTALEDTEADDADKRRRLFATLKDELTRHTQAEEQVFYSQLKKHERARDDTEEAIEEHHEVEQLLQRMEEMDVASEEWMESLGECREMVEHHVEEEEGRLFGEADEFFHDRLDRLGEQFEEQKGRMA